MALVMMVVLYELFQIFLYAVVIGGMVIFVLSLIFDTYLRAVSPKFYIFVLGLCAILATWCWQQDHQSSVIIFIVMISIWGSRVYMMPIVNKAESDLKKSTYTTVKIHAKRLVNLSIFIVFVQICVVGIASFW